MLKVVIPFWTAIVEVPDGFIHMPNDMKAEYLRTHLPDCAIPVFTQIRPATPTEVEDEMTDMDRLLVQQPPE